MDLLESFNEAASSVTQLGEQKSIMPPATPMKPKVLLGSCGCVAAVKFALLCKCFLNWAEVRAVVTRASLKFVDKTEISKDVPLYTDEYEWFSWEKYDDPVLHIDLANWAEIMVIAPLSAETLAKIAGGCTDNLLTCVVRAWDYSKPIFVAPSMGTSTWKNPFTDQHLTTINDLGMNIILPQRTASGHTGGVMAEPERISSEVMLYYNAKMQREPGRVWQLR
ncbi:hypothetical protein PIB30_023492 [Stylosanthes scabra]|uniref:phosphopantothenoylcysteine decarboxylase n=1 Tax=Stylosanthes scabra TaxID=79078 RepID=A0ABU6S9N0_9FABA|nr:hypothetical protein [Stylosanthes scabra]